MKSLLRLYPRSWRKRYGQEMEVLVEAMPGRLGIALDLVIGAAVAYRDVIRGNRVLAAAGAYLHGICVAVLVQAIGFVSLVLAAQQWGLTDLRIGPFVLATVVPSGPFFRLGELSQAMWVAVFRSWLPEGILLAVLLVALALLLAAPRLLRRLG